MKLRLQDRVIDIPKPLTWQDIRRIVIIADELCNEWGTERMHNEGQEVYYTEVLKRYNDEMENNNRDAEI